MFVVVVVAVAVAVVVVAVVGVAVDDRKGGSEMELIILPPHLFRYDNEASPGLDEAIFDAVMKKVSRRLQSWVNFCSSKSFHLCGSL